MPGAVAPAFSRVHEVRKKRTRVIHRYNRTHAGIPCAVVYGLYVVSPESGLVSLRRIALIRGDT
jgi:hypothetical protein